MILSKKELAQAFEVSTNSIDNWTMRGLPQLSGGKPGVACQYAWPACETWLFLYKIWKDHADPDEVIGRAYHRAIGIVKERTRRERMKRKPKAPKAAA
jgi:hypothetical protein